jgi:hypothetical protein
VRRTIFLLRCGNNPIISGMAATSKEVSGERSMGHEGW